MIEFPNPGLLSTGLELGTDILCEVTGDREEAEDCFFNSWDNGNVRFIFVAEPCGANVSCEAGETVKVRISGLSNPFAVLNMESKFEVTTGK